jgi:uncharacterized protein (TIGR02596 family)
MKKPIPFSQRAFTLIEVLAVLGIVAILMAGASPVLFSAIKANRLTSAASVVTAKLNEVQGLALTFASDFEVRLLSAAGDGLDSPESLQVFTLPDPSASGSEDEWQPVGSPELLPDGLAFSRNERFSSVLKAPSSEVVVSATDRRTLATIRFFPDGSTNLPESENWFITVVENSQRDTDVLPANFTTVQIDPVTGKLETYRPD